MLINLIHIFFSGPLLAYVGYFEPKDKWIYYVLLVIAVLVLLSFISLILTQKYSERHIWYLVHVLLFVPLLLYVGWHKDKTQHAVFSLMLAVGIAAIGYHALRLIQRLN